MTGRIHTGPHRNEEARRAILDAALSLLRSEGYAALTIGAIAREAGVGRQTIYRWWSTKADIVLDAMIELGRHTVPLPPPDRPLRERLTTFLEKTYVNAQRADIAPVLRALMAEAQRDPEFAPRFAAFAATRRDALREVLGGDAGPRADLAVDLAFALLWYRLLLGHAPLTAAVAREVADVLTEALEG
jgi:AcrR family transcriptional regulator